MQHLAFIPYNTTFLTVKKRSQQRRSEPQIVKQMYECVKMPPDLCAGDIGRSSPPEPAARAVLQKSQHRPSGTICAGRLTQLKGLSSSQGEMSHPAGAGLR